MVPWQRQVPWYWVVTLNTTSLGPSCNWRDSWEILKKGGENPLKTTQKGREFCYSCTIWACQVDLYCCHLAQGGNSFFCASFLMFELSISLSYPNLCFNLCAHQLLWCESESFLIRHASRCEYRLCLYGGRVLLGFPVVLITRGWLFFQSVIREVNRAFKCFNINLCKWARTILSQECFLTCLSYSQPAQQYNRPHAQRLNPIGNKNSARLVFIWRVTCSQLT